MQATARRRSPWNSRYRRYVRAVVKGDVIDFVVSGKRAETLLKVRTALEESLRNEDIVEKILEPPPLLDPFVVRVKIKKNAFFRDVDRLIEKYSSYSHFGF